MEVVKDLKGGVLMVKSVDVNLDILIKAIKEAKEKSKKRNFTQSIDLFIAIDGLDLKRPENRIRMIVKLPNKSNKVKKVALIADGGLVEAAKGIVDAVLTSKDLESIAGSKREIRKIAKRYDFFIAEPKLMSLVGKIMGFALGPRGKMPQIVPPNADIKSIVDNLKSSVLINVRNNPMVGVSIGTEDMDDKALAENALTVIEAVKSKLPEKAYISRIYVKTTMGPTVKVA